MYFQNPLPLSLPTALITFLKLMKIYVTQRSSISCHVCKIPACTRIYITFNATSPAAHTPFSFTVSLCVCCPSSKAAKSKCIELIFFLIIECFSIVYQSLYPSTFSKYTTSVIPGIVSKTIFCVGSAKRTLLCGMH